MLDLLLSELLVARDEVKSPRLSSLTPSLCHLLRLEKFGRTDLLFRFLLSF